jgi:hypothetical protein
MITRAYIAAKVRYSFTVHNRTFFACGPALGTFNTDRVSLLDLSIRYSLNFILSGDS